MAIASGCCKVVPSFRRPPIRPMMPSPPSPVVQRPLPPVSQPPVPALVGLPICPGTVIGEVRVLKAVADLRMLPPDCILVVPYLKARELPAIAQMGIRGLIAETGGQLSNGAIIAREYGLPTVVLPQRRDLLKARQRVRLQGDAGSVELL